MTESNKKSPSEDFIKNIVITFVVIMFSIGFYFAIFKPSVRFFKATYKLYHCDLENKRETTATINGEIFTRKIPMSLEYRVFMIEKCLSNTE